MEDAVAFVRREVAAGRAADPEFRISVRMLAKKTTCARQTAMLALQALRAAGAVTLDERGNYRLCEGDDVEASRANELDMLVDADLRRLYDRGFTVEEIRAAYRRKLPRSFLAARG